MRVPYLVLISILCPSLSHADDLATAKPNPPVLKELTSEFPTGEKLEYRVMTATLQPGTNSPWHTHAAPVAVYVENGTFTLEKKKGKSLSIKTGEALLEPTGVEVRAANNGNTPATVVIFQVSNPEKPFLYPTK